MGLKIDIKNLRFRRSDRRLSTSDQLRIISQRLSNPAAIRLREGDDLADLKKISDQRRPLYLEISEVKIGSTAEVDRLFQSAVAQMPWPEIPEMIDVSEKLSIMKNELTVGQFGQFVCATEYEIKSLFEHEAKAFEAFLKSVKDGDALVYINLFDGRAYAKWLSEKTGRKFRVQTQEEWLQVKDKLSGDNWTWTETRESDGYILLQLGCTYWKHVRPESRHDDNAIRLVEDKIVA